MPFIYNENGTATWTDGETATQRTRKLIRSYQQPAEQKPAPKQEGKSELEKIFSELESRGVSRDEIMAKIDNLKEGESVEKLREDIPPKEDEVDQTQLKTAYDSEYANIRSNGEKRAVEINALNRKYRGMGLKGSL